MNFATLESIHIYILEQQSNLNSFETNFGRNYLICVYKLGKNSEVRNFVALKTMSRFVLV